ncbi:MAG: acetate--CoA ligase family protein [Actinobacteria bacterium]|nr:acetate--CoA ligase family protein [Actinomycetota bacterium]
MTDERSRAVAELFAPRSVALVGASSRPGTFGYGAAQDLLAGVDSRAVYLVNAKGSPVLGHETFRSLRELPEKPTTAVLAVPKASFDLVLEEALDAGVESIVALSAGFAEAGEEGLRHQEEVVGRVRQAGSVLLGPNTIGLFHAASNLRCLPFGAPIRPGPIAVIAQSGSVIFDQAGRAERAGVGLSLAASLGNQADVDAADLIRLCAADPGTRCVALYLEDFGRGRELMEAASACVKAGKAVVVLSPPRTDSTIRASRSHTGALLSDTATVEAACRQVGAIQVSSLRELGEVALAALTPQRARGRRVLILAGAGAQGVMAGAAASAVGLEAPRLSDPLQVALTAEVMVGGSAANPIDLNNLGDSFARTLERVFASGEVDSALLVMDLLLEEDESPLESLGLKLVEICAAHEMPLVTASFEPEHQGLAALRAAGFPVYREIESAARALATLTAAPAGQLPPLPPTAQPVDLEPADYFGARDLFAEHGLPFGPARAAASWDDARAVAAALGYPVVLKAIGSIHKSDAGGVALGLDDEPALRQAWEAQVARGAAEWSVEPMAPPGSELLVGARTDPRFGPVVLVGPGGLFAELFGDTALALAPLTVAEAGALIGRLKIAPILAGARGVAAVDLDAAARAVVAVGALVASHPEIAEAEVNPLRLRPDGCVALDARVILEGAL